MNSDSTSLAEGSIWNATAILNTDTEPDKKTLFNGALTTEETKIGANTNNLTINGNSSTSDVRENSIDNSWSNIGESSETSNFLKQLENVVSKKLNASRQIEESTTKIAKTVVRIADTEITTTENSKIPKPLPATAQANPKAPVPTIPTAPINIKTARTEERLETTQTISNSEPLGPVPKRPKSSEPSSKDSLPLSQIESAAITETKVSETLTGDEKFENDQKMRNLKDFQ